MKVVWIVKQCWDYEGCIVKGVFDTEDKAEEFADTFSTGVGYGSEVEEWEVK